MPVHDRVFEVEALEIRHGCRLHLFRKAEVPAQLTDFANVQFNEELLVFRVEKFDPCRRALLLPLPFSKTIQRDEREHLPHLPQTRAR
jgi:hypothetical protein